MLPYRLPKQRSLSPFQKNLPKYEYNYRTYHPSKLSSIKNSRSFASRQRSYYSQIKTDTIENIDKVQYTDTGYLLSSQNLNIKRFKNRIESQKKKVEEDFNNFRKELQYIIEDSKLSVQAQLDTIYVTYIETYAILKSQIQQIRVNKKQAIRESDTLRTFRNNNKYSNDGLYAQIQQEIQFDKNYQQSKLFTKEKKGLVDQLAKQLLQIGQNNRQFYQKVPMLNQLECIKENLKLNMKDIHYEMNSYVSHINEIFHQPNQNINNTHQTGFFDTKCNIPLSNDRFKTISEYTRFNKVSFNKVGNGQQNIIVKEKIQPLQFTKINTVFTNHNDSILCVCFIGNFIATGSRDHTINIYNQNGSLIRKLEAHNSPICCLTSVKSQFGEILASGSDHGCSSMALWNPQNWSLKLKKQCHSAALTSIIDMNDLQHVVSGGYDKKIQIVNIQSGDIVFVIPDLKSPIIGMLITSDSSKIVSALLNHSLFIFGIESNINGGKILKHLRTISCDSMICSLKSLTLQPNIILAGTKEGVIKVYDSNYGSLVNSLNADSTAIIEMAVIQSENYNPIIINCTSKSTALNAIEMFTGKKSSIKLSSKLDIEFGCGIGPKIVFDNQKKVLIANQSNLNRQFTIYQLNGLQYTSIQGQIR